MQTHSAERLPIIWSNTISWGHSKNIGAIKLITGATFAIIIFGFTRLSTINLSDYGFRDIHGGFHLHLLVFLFIY